MSIFFTENHTQNTELLLLTNNLTFQQDVLNCHVRKKNKKIYLEIPFTFAWFIFFNLFIKTYNDYGLNMPFCGLFCFGICHVVVFRAV